MPYRIEYAASAEQHLRVLPTHRRVLVLDAIDVQLAFQPTAETRNRKRMRANPIAPWELRIDNIRVYYDVIEQPEAVVQILAIGIKDHNRVYIGGREVDL